MPRLLTLLVALTCIVSGPALATASGKGPLPPVTNTMVVDNQYVGSKLMPSRDNPPMLIWPTGSDFNSQCKSVFNDTDQTFFVPYRTDREWSSFIASASTYSIRMAVSSCCAPKSISICGTTTQLGQRTVITRSQTKPNYGAQSDVSGPYVGGANYNVTYVCDNRDWVKVEERGSCDGRPKCSSQNGSRLRSLNVGSLCSLGTALNVTPGPTQPGPWTWQCGNDLGTVSCRAEYDTTPINGKCGSYKGKYVAMRPSLTSTATCSAGTAINMAGTVGGAWTWTCKALDGGRDDTSCYTLASPPPVNQVNGTCGLADGTYIPVAPNFNLCATGSATSVSGRGPWTWTCKGSGTAYTSQSCKAYLCDACTGSLTQNRESDVSIVSVPSAGAGCTLATKYTWTELLMRELISGDITVKLNDSMGITYTKNYTDQVAEVNYCKPCNLRQNSISNAKLVYKAVAGNCGSISTEFTSEPVRSTQIIK